MKVFSKEKYEEYHRINGDPIMDWINNCDDMAPVINGSIEDKKGGYMCIKDEWTIEISDHKIDCSKTENYFKEKARMSGGGYRDGNCQGACVTCGLSSNNNKRSVLCSQFQSTYPLEAIAIVQAWSDEHPLKTYLDDYKEKFPPDKFPHAYQNNGYPRKLPCGIYFDNDYENCPVQRDLMWDWTMEE